LEGNEPLRIPPARPEFRLEQDIRAKDPVTKETGTLKVPQRKPTIKMTRGCFGWVM
jgi:hypothetical protein